MRIEIGYDIAFEAPAAVPMVLMLDVHPIREPDLEVAEAAIFEPLVPSRRFSDRFGNRATRLVAPEGGFLSPTMVFRPCSSARPAKAGRSR
jgi:hypothetical protein